MSYYGQGEAKFDGLVAWFIRQCRQVKAARLAKQLTPGGVVLDVGCGDGSFLSALGGCGDFELHGLELDGLAARRARRDPRLHLHLGDLLAAGYPRERFDLVTLFHVFEHLAEPKRTLTELYEIVKPGGSVVLSFPNAGSVQAQLFNGDWLHLDPPRHLFLLDPQTAEREFRRAGFSVIGRRFFSVEQNPFGFIQSVLNLVLADRDVLYERLKGNEGYAPRHGRWSLWLQKAVAGVLLGPAIVVDAVESAFGRGATVEYFLRKDPAE
ncbi:MAG: class I SAM-dependent methyltransferase [Opitutaceae bacterium]|nr:class I SAM-dependent methyltransferase [Opitutaceae bacterium]